MAQAATDGQLRLGRGFMQDAALEPAGTPRRGRACERSPDLLPCPHVSKPIISAGGDDLLGRPVSAASEEDLHSLFLGGAKPESEWMVGTEFELFGFDEATGLPIEHETIAELLADIGKKRGWAEERETNGALVGLKGDGQAVSLEPGGQIEYATRPYRALRALRDEMLGYCDDLREAGAGRDVGFWCLGHQPFVHLDDAPRMPKPRYDMMRRYLGERGARALEMMHLTSSIQCTVDFKDEKNLTDKVRTAVRASPFVAALVAASPFTRGKPNGFKTLRYQIWLETDDQRCGIWPEMLDVRGLTVERILERAMRLPPMFFIRDERFIPPPQRPFSAFVKEGFEGTPVTVRDLLDHLTTFFPEVRAKGYVELRSADCLPPAFVTAVAGFWRGILDDEDTRMQVEDRLSVLDYEALRELQPRIAREGLEADTPAGPAAELARWLVELAYSRLARGAPDCAECVQPLRELAERRRSPADDMLEQATKTSVRDALELVRI